METLFNWIMTIVLCMAPPIIYTFVVNKQKLPKKRARRVCIISGLCIWIGLVIISLLLYVCTGEDVNLGNPLPVFLWSSVAYIFIRESSDTEIVEIKDEGGSAGFGYSTSKPIIVSDFDRQLDYLNRLTTKDNQKINYTFVGIEIDKNTDIKCDKYKITSDSIEPLYLYFYREGDHTSKYAPEGFKLQNDENEIIVSSDTAGSRLPEASFLLDEVYENDEKQKDVNTASETAETKGCEPFEIRDEQMTKQKQDTVSRTGRRFNSNVPFLFSLALCIAIIIALLFFVVAQKEAQKEELGSAKTTNSKLVKENKKLAKYKNAVVNCYDVNCVYVWREDTKYYHRPNCPTTANFEAPLAMDVVLAQSIHEMPGNNTFTKKLKPCPTCMDENIEEYIERNF